MGRKKSTNRKLAKEAPPAFEQQSIFAHSIELAKSTLFSAPLQLAKSSINSIRGFQKTENLTLGRLSEELSIERKIRHEAIEQIQGQLKALKRDIKNELKDLSYTQQKQLDSIDGKCLNVAIRQKTPLKLPPPPLRPPSNPPVTNGVLYKDHEQFKKYFNMLSFGIPKGAVEQKMIISGVDPAILGRGNEIYQKQTEQPKASRPKLPSASDLQMSLGRLKKASSQPPARPTPKPKTSFGGRPNITTADLQMSLGRLKKASNQSAARFTPKPKTSFGGRPNITTADLQMSLGRLKKSSSEKPVQQNSHTNLTPMMAELNNVLKSRLRPSSISPLQLSINRHKRPASGENDLESPSKRRRL